MIIADTSAWIESFKDPSHPIVGALNAGLILGHAFVLGELVCGGLTPRHDEFDLLMTLPHARTVHHDEAMRMVIDRRLGAAGIGWTDAHLLASAFIDGHAIMTHDRRLIIAAARCDVRVEPPR